MLSLSGSSGPSQQLNNSIVLELQESAQRDYRELVMEWYRLWDRKGSKKEREDPSVNGKGN